MDSPGKTDEPIVIADNRTIDPAYVRMEAKYKQGRFGGALKHVVRPGRRGGIMKPASVVLIAVLVVLPAPAWGEGGDMRIEDLLEKHLGFLTDGKAPSSVNNRLLLGTCSFRVLIGRSASLSGPVNFLSQGNKVRLLVRFNDSGYRGENIIHDGKSVRVDQISPGARSQLGDFFYRFEEVVREGLVGGVLSTAWPLLDLKRRQAKLEYEGLKKIEGQELHGVTYHAKRPGEARVHLYFDPESYGHMLTIYRVMVSRSGSVAIRTTRDRFTLEERFGDFRALDGWALPSQWSLKLTLQTDRGNSVSEWSMAIDNASHNQQMNPQYFKLK